MIHYRVVECETIVRDKLFNMKLTVFLWIILWTTYCLAGNGVSKEGDSIGTAGKRFVVIYILSHSNRYINLTFFKFFFGYKNYGTFVSPVAKQSGY